MFLIRVFRELTIHKVFRYAFALSQLQTARDFFITTGISFFFIGTESDRSKISAGPERSVCFFMC